MTSSIILTHCGKLGDFLYCLPIASWLAKTRGVKIRWALPDRFPPFHHVTPLLHTMPCTEDVTLLPFPVKNFEAGGQPYKHNPAEFGMEGEYYNLGIRGYPDSFMPDYCAREYQLGWDPHFNLELGDVEPTDKILRGEQKELAKSLPQSEQYPMFIDLLELGRMLKAAKERHLWFSGPAAMMYLARIPFTLYWEKGHPPRSLYLNRDHFGGSFITEKEHIRR